MGVTQTLGTDQIGRYVGAVLPGWTTIRVNLLDIRQMVQLATNQPTNIYVPAEVLTNINVSSPSSATVTGLVWEDRNADGIFEPEIERGLTQITVLIKDSTGGIQTLKTDANGRYTAQIAPGNVDINVDENDPGLPKGSLLMTGNDPITVFIPSGTSGGTDFGFHPQGVVTGIVWEDTNGDSIYSSGNENVLPGIAVFLIDSLGRSQVLTTDLNGRYIALVAPGPVTVKVDRTDNDLLANGIPTGAHNPATISILAGETEWVDFGFQFKSEIILSSAASSISNPKALMEDLEGQDSR